MRFAHARVENKHGDAFPAQHIAVRVWADRPALVVVHAAALVDHVEAVVPIRLIDNVLRPFRIKIRVRNVVLLRHVPKHIFPVNVELQQGAAVRPALGRVLRGELCEAAARMGLSNFGAEHVVVEHVKPTAVHWLIKVVVWDDPVPRGPNRLDLLDAGDLELVRALCTRALALRVVAHGDSELLNLRARYFDSLSGGRGRTRADSSQGRRLRRCGRCRRRRRRPR